MVVVVVVLLLLLLMPVLPQVLLPSMLPQVLVLPVQFLLCHYYLGREGKRRSELLLPLKLLGL